MYSGSRNPWTDRYKILHVGCRPRHKHTCQFLWRSVEGVWRGEWSNFGLFHWLALAPLWHSRTTVLACDESLCKDEYIPSAHFLRVFRHHSTYLHASYNSMENITSLTMHAPHENRYFKTIFCSQMSQMLSILLNQWNASNWRIITIEVEKDCGTGRHQRRKEYEAVWGISFTPHPLPATQTQPHKLKQLSKTLSHLSDKYNQ